MPLTLSVISLMSRLSGSGARGGEQGCLQSDHVVDGAANGIWIKWLCLTHTPVVSVSVSDSHFNPEVNRKHTSAGVQITTVPELHKKKLIQNQPSLSERAILSI